MRSSSMPGCWAATMDGAQRASMVVTSVRMQSTDKGNGAPIWLAPPGPEFTVVRPDLHTGQTTGEHGQACVSPVGLVLLVLHEPILECLAEVCLFDSAEHVHFELADEVPEATT